MDWAQATDFLTAVRSLCPVCDPASEVHDVGLALGRRYGFSAYDAMIVAAALITGRRRLLSEDMQHGMVVEGRLTINNPFRGHG